MSIERPKGSYTGPLSLQWCNYSMTVRAMPMNYLAADLSRIDAALWGRESEIGAAIAEAPAMVEALRNLLSDMEVLGIIDFYDQDLCQGIGGAVSDARAILSRIDGATPTDEPATPTGEDAHRFTVIWGNIGDDAGKRLDHVTVKDATHSAIMDAAFACFFADLEAAGEILSESDRDEFRNHTAYDGFAILPGHVTDAPGLGF